MTSYCSYALLVCFVLLYKDKTLSSIFCKAIFEMECFFVALFAGWGCSLGAFPFFLSFASSDLTELCVSSSREQTKRSHLVLSSFCSVYNIDLFANGLPVKVGLGSGLFKCTYLFKRNTSEFVF